MIPFDHIFDLLVILFVDKVIGSCGSRSQTRVRNAVVVHGGRRSRVHAMDGGMRGWRGSMLKVPKVGRRCVPMLLSIIVDLKKLRLFLPHGGSC